MTVIDSWAQEREQMGFFGERTEWEERDEPEPPESYKGIISKKNQMATIRLL